MALHPTEGKGSEEKRERDRAAQEVDRITADRETGDRDSEGEAKSPQIRRNLEEAQDRVDETGDDHP